MCVEKLKGTVGGAYRSSKQHPILDNNWNIEDYLRETKKSYICQFLPPDLSLDNYHQVLESLFVYVGVTERLQHSVDILAQKLGFSTMPVIQANVSEWDEPVPDGAREEFEENNPLEMAIYSYARNNWGNSTLELTAHQNTPADACTSRRQDS